MDYETKQAFLKQQAAISDITRQLDVTAAQRLQAEHVAAQRKAIDAMAEIQGKLIDRSAAYTNLMLLGGYAGFFALWSGTRPNLPEKANIAVAGLAGLSLAIFIVFEIYKMIITFRRFLKSRAFLVAPGSPEEFVQRLEEFKKEEAKAPLGYLVIWIVALSSAIGFAVLAFALLSYNFLAVLIGFEKWPT